MHSVWALKAGNLSPEQAQIEAEITKVLETPQGVALALRRRAACAVIMVEAAQAYVTAEVDAGTDLSEIPVFKMLPALQNSASRLLQACLGLAPDEPEADAEVRRIQETLGVGNGTT
ncbi:MAG: hypothetical protein ABSB61_04900 [Anaerolineales bacterium]